MTVLFAFMMIGSVAFSLWLAVQMIQTLRVETTLRMRWLTWLLVGYSGMQLIGAAWILGTIMLRLEWLPSSTSVLVTQRLAFGMMVIALVYWAAVWWVLATTMRELGSATRIMGILSSKATTTLDDADLTPRELSVLEIMACGKVTNEEIADSLVISPATAGTHVRNIMNKAGVHQRADLLLIGE